MVRKFVEKDAYNLNYLQRDGTFWRNCYCVGLVKCPTIDYNKLPGPALTAPFDQKFWWSKLEEEKKDMVVFNIAWLCKCNKTMQAYLNTVEIPKMKTNNNIIFIIFLISIAFSVFYLFISDCSYLCMNSSNYCQE